MRKQSFVLRARGMTLLEITVAMGILSVAFVGIMLFMKVMVNGLYSESIESDQQTRTAGQMYDILAEVRQATAQSPHFAVAGSTTIPPSITFDLPAGTNAVGDVVWGSQITYRLALNPGYYIDNAGTVQDAMILRDEVPAGVGGTTTTTVIEQHVPYKITENGVTYWGFNVAVNSNALTISIRRSGDTNVNLGTSVTPTGSTQGTLATAIFTGTYYLRNSQVALPATQ